MIPPGESPWVISVSTDPDWGVEQVGDEWKWHVTDGETTVHGFAPTKGEAERRVEAELEWWEPND